MKIGRLKPNTWTYMRKYWTCKMGDFRLSLTLICPGCLKLMVDSSLHYKTIKLVKDGRKKIKKEYIQHTKCGTILCLVR
jgi:hypothetical protein